MIIPGGLVGQIVEKGKLKENQYQPVNTDSLEYCWLHNLTLTSDWKHPNAEDKKKLDKIRLVEAETIEPDGTSKKFRYCQKCGNTVYYTNTP